MACSNTGGRVIMLLISYLHHVQSITHSKLIIIYKDVRTYARMERWQESRTLRPLLAISIVLNEYKNFTLEDVCHTYITVDKVPSNIP